MYSWGSVAGSLVAAELLADGGIVHECTATNELALAIAAQAVGRRSAGALATLAVVNEALATRRVNPAAATLTAVELEAVLTRRRHAGAVSLVALEATAETVRRRTVSVRSVFAVEITTRLRYFALAQAPHPRILIVEPLVRSFFVPSDRREFYVDADPDLDVAPQRRRLA